MWFLHLHSGIHQRPYGTMLGACERLLAEFQIRVQPETPSLRHVGRRR